MNADEELNPQTGWQGLNLYAYCNNSPVVHQDSEGRILDTVFDVLSLGVSIVDVFRNPQDPFAWVGLGMDVACLLIPGLTGGGAVVKAVAKADDVVDIAKTTTKTLDAVDNLVDAKKAVKNATGTVDNLAKGACFVEGTLVSTPEGPKPIEKIRPGDTVWAENPETGQKSIKSVVRTFPNQSEELVHVFVGGETITATPEHPFYSPVKGWVEAAKLRAGDILVMQNGQYVVVEQVQHEILESPIEVFNFEVEDFHTYYVGKSAALVHNKCGMGSVHGNSLKTTKPAQGYALVEKNTGAVLKYGETTLGSQRYTKKYLG